MTDGGRCWLSAGCLAGDGASLGGSVVLLHCGCLSLNPFIEFRIWNNSSSSDVLNVQASISISPIQRQQVTVINCCMTAEMLQYSIY